MSLDITPRAANVCSRLRSASFSDETNVIYFQRLRDIMVRDSNPDLALRIQVESGGCHGFQYLMSLVSAGPDSVREDDTVLSYADDDAGPSSTRGVDGSGPGRPKIVLDTPSLELLNGSKVDFTMELIGSQFKIVDNPLATSSCGCGTSFDIKV
jgi:iron-sulfur cluster assembly 2